MKNILQSRAERAQRAALTAGYAEFSKKLNLYALSRTHNAATSDDLVQETFLKTWKFLVKGGDIKKMEAFLYHILKDLIVDEYRKRKTTSLEVLLEKGFDPGFDLREQHVDILDGESAMRLIEHLPVQYQKVIRMRFIQDLSLAEISLITGKSKNAIAVQVHRGLEKLRTLHRNEVK